MPHVRQNMCFAVCVPNVYVASSSPPVIENDVERQRAQTTYSCRPTRDVVAGCVGGLQWANGQDDVDKTFPLGCGVNVPECFAVAIGNARMFECTLGPDGKPDWYEPI